MYHTANKNKNSYSFLKRHLLAFSLLLLPSLVQAQVTSLEMFTLTDGTGPFVAPQAPGGDASPHNEFIRTHDEITYRTIFSTNGGDTQVIGSFVLPNIDAGPTAGDPVATWREVPPQCTGASSAISADGRTLTCDLGNLPNPSTIAIEPVAIVSGRAPNGQEIVFANSAIGEGVASVSSIETPALDANYYETIINPVSGLGEKGALTADGTLSQQVSAAPRFDLMLGDSLGGGTSGGGVIAHSFNGAAGPAGEDGLSLTYGVFMFAQDIKGSEMLDPNQSFSYRHFLLPAGTSPIPQTALDSAKLVSWVGPSGNQSQNLNPGCANGSLNNYYMPRDLGPTASNDHARVSNGGSVSCTQTTAGDDINATITGIDASLEHFPTKLRVGGGTNPVLNREWYVMSKRVASFMPLSVIPTVGTFSFDGCVDFINPPVSITGQINTDPNPFVDQAHSGNQCRLDALIRSKNGSYHKRLTANYGALPLNAQRDVRITGDNRVNIAAPGQSYRSRLAVNNRGSDSITYQICDKIDNARQVVLPGNLTGDFQAITLHPSFNPPAMGSVEWGVRIGDGAGNVSDSWGQFPNANLVSLGGDALNENQSTSATGNPLFGSGTQYETTACPNADSTGNTAGAPEAYFPTQQAAIDAGYSRDQITMVRVSGVMGAGQVTYLSLGLQLRTHFRYDATDTFLKPAGPNLVYQAGDAIPRGSHVPNYASFIQNGGTPSTISRDLLEVQSIRHLRIKKTASPASGLQVAPAQTITYTLQGNYTTPDLGTPKDVVITDILPSGLSYLATTNGPAPVITADTPAPGFTKLEWTLENQTPTSVGIGGSSGNLPVITFTARVNTNITSGDQFFNWAKISDGGSDFDAECSYDPANNAATGFSACHPNYSTLPVKADKTVHTVSAPPGFQLFKEVLDPLIYTTSDYTHRINWASIGANTPNLRVIDILPYNGDGRGSNFHGTSQLTSATATADLAASNAIIYYTLQAQANISTIPFDPSNALDGTGSTVWCDAGDDANTPDLGTASCPATLADATAVMVNQTSILTAGTTYGVDLTFSTTDNQEGDIYANNHTSDDQGNTLNLLTGNTVITRVVEPTVGDKVWYDYNADGVQDTAEPGLDNITITLTGTDIKGDAVNISTTTNHNGEYLFNKNNGLIRPSDADGYTISVTPLAGFVPTFDLDDGAFYPNAAITSNSSGSFVLNASDHKDDVDFGYYQLGQIVIKKDVRGGDSANPWLFMLSSEVTGCVIPASEANPANTANGGDSNASFNHLPLFSSTTGDACTFNVVEVAQAGYAFNAAASSATTGLAITPAAPQLFVDMINEKLGSISGKVSEDIDGAANGALLPLKDVTMTLLNGDGSVYDNDPSTAGVQALTTLTDANGNYQFNEIPLGEYRVQQTDLATYSSVNDRDTSNDNDTVANSNQNDNQIPVTITAGEVDANNDFIDERLGSIAGKVSEDIDGAGNAALVPLKDVTLSLLNADGSVYDSDPNTAGVQALTTLSNASGDYSFSNLPLGQYIVQQTDLANYNSVSDADSSDDGDTTANVNTNDNQIPVTLTPAEADLNNDFVDERKASISGTVSEDIDGAGNAALVPLSNVTLTLLNGDGSVYDSDPATAGIQPLTQQTNTQGHYTFSDLSAGEYQIRQTDLATYTSVSDADSSDDGDTTANANSNNNLIPVTLKPSEIDADNDFIDERKASISGNVFEDVDGAGSAALVPLKDVTITLLNADGSVYDSSPAAGIQALTQITDATGNYTFSNLSPGEYLIAETDLATYSSISDQDSSDDGDTVANSDSNNNQLPVTLTPAEADADNNFIDERRASITGNVSEDIDGTGTAALVPLADVTLTLLNADGSNYDSDPNTVGVQTLTTSTDASGNYHFTDLPLGEYIVQQTDLATYSSMSDNDSSNDNDTTANTNNNDNQIPVSLTPNEIDADNNFIDVRKASITGNVFEDIDGAGTAALVPLADVTLTLLNADSSVYDSDPSTAGIQPLTATTNTDGHYTFTDLPLGEYQVQQTDLAAYSSLSDADTSDDGDTRANTNTNNNLIPVTLGAAEIDADNNFIDERRAGISGRVFEDIDGAGEAPLVPIENVTLTLLNADGTPYDSDPATADVQSLTTTTDATGHYHFSGVPLGEYIIQQTDLAGYYSMNDDDTSDDADTTANTNTNDNQIPVTLTAAEADADNNFIDERRANISGNVSEDIDGTGDAALVPLENITLTLLNADGTPYDSDPETEGVQTLTTLTDVDGNYQFQTLPLGDYIVQQTDLASYTSISDADSSDDQDTHANTDGNDNQIPVTLSAAETDADNNFVDERHGSISGNVSALTQNDDPATPIQGVLLSLLDANGNPVMDENDQPITSITDVEGKYQFNHLPAGHYQVLQQQPAGYESVSDVQGNLEDNLILEITLTAAQQVTGRNFVEQRLAPIGPNPIPTLSEWAVMLLILMLGWLSFQQGNVYQKPLKTIKRR